MAPGGGGGLGCGGWERKGVRVFRLLIGEESREGERRFPLQLGFRGLLPGTKLNTDGIYQSALHVSFRHCRSGAVFIALVQCVSAWVHIRRRESYRCVFCFVMVLRGLIGSHHV